MNQMLTAMGTVVRREELLTIKVSALWIIHFCLERNGLQPSVRS